MGTFITWALKVVTSKGFIWGCKVLGAVTAAGIAATEAGKAELYRREELCAPKKEA